jgi:large subunit ribosomal protein L30
MLNNIAHLVAWGEIDPPTLATLLEKRARGNGGRRLTEEYVKSSLGYKDMQEFAQALHEGKTDLRNIHELKPVFRLTPPSGGYPRKLKRHYKDKGEYGYRGEAINLLISRMC